MQIIVKIGTEWYVYLVQHQHNHLTELFLLHQKKKVGDNKINRSNVQIKVARKWVTGLLISPSAKPPHDTPLNPALKHNFLLHQGKNYDKEVDNWENKIKMQIKGKTEIELHDLPSLSPVLKHNSFLHQKKQTIMLNNK